VRGTISTDSRHSTLKLSYPHFECEKLTVYLEKPSFRRHQHKPFGFGFFDAKKPQRLTPISSATTIGGLGYGFKFY
jgi:hypothetical protein